MYLKTVEMCNFRKFGDVNNVVKFVDTSSYQDTNQEQVNIAKLTSLIVGKNNVGKTTVIQGMNKIINGNKIKSTDFNYGYLNELLVQYRNSQYETMPEIKFTIVIGLEAESKDYITNLVPFMKLEDVNADEVKITLKYEIQDKEIFDGKIKKLLIKGYSQSKQFSKFLEVIDESEILGCYYNSSNEMIDKFKLKDLMEFMPISANAITSEKCLSSAFNRIVKYRYQDQLKNEKEGLEDNIEKINSRLSSSFAKVHTKKINQSIKKMIASEDMQIGLNADLTFEKLMDSIIKYEYLEGDNHIPENQFGLGYTNLMMIIASIIEYMEKFPNTAFNSKINLIGIEEPETYMHPQMQELFITYINDAINILMKTNAKNINTQLIVTTHSSYILNSKIHTGGSFDQINYMRNDGGKVKVVALSDNVIAPNGDKQSDEFTFIKKHIKFQVSDIFFSDVIIFVEGITEYMILPYFTSKRKKLKNKSITIVNINGAHAMVYAKLIKRLGIPALIITDLDIKRTKPEKDEFVQIKSLDGRTTTNTTIGKFNADVEKIDHIEKMIKSDNICIIYQVKEGAFIPTSFEEALILKNFKSATLNKVLKKVKPTIYKQITVDGTILSRNKRNSYKWQRKLSEDKSEFANEILYQLLVNEDNDIKLPKYIEDGLSEVENMLGGN